MQLLIAFLASLFLAQPVCQSPADSKFYPASFDEEEFIATIPDLRTMARAENERAARRAYADCAKAVQADPVYETEKDRQAALAYCPVLPRTGKQYFREDISCEIGEYCGPNFPLSKKDQRLIKAYFYRKVAAVKKAQELRMHVDAVEAYATNQAKPPELLQKFWGSRSKGAVDTEVNN